MDGAELPVSRVRSLSRDESFVAAGEALYGTLDERVAARRGGRGGKVRELTGVAAVLRMPHEAGGGCCFAVGSGQKEELM